MKHKLTFLLLMFCLACFGQKSDTLTVGEMTMIQTFHEVDVLYKPKTKTTYKKAVAVKESTDNNVLVKESKDNTYSPKEETKWTVVEPTKNEQVGWTVAEPVTVEKVESTDKHYLPRIEHEKYSEEIRQIDQLQSYIPYLKIYSR